MKFGKILKCLSSLALASALLLTSCTGNTGDKNDASQDGASEDISEESSETQDDRLYTLISRGKPYTTSAQASDHYLDLFGQQLTDGQKTPDDGVFYTDIRMVGYTSNCRIDIDLGDDGKRISAVAIRSLDLNQDGVKLAGNAIVYGSNDGTEWERIAHKNFKQGEDRTVATLWLEPKEVCDYRYIRASILLREGSAFFFTDEIEVYADIPAEEVTSTLGAAYEKENIDRNEWKKLSTGVKASPAAYQNVALGTKYELKNAEVDPRAEEAYKIAKNMSRNTVKPAFDTLLTDGAHTGMLFGERVWTGVKASKPSSIQIDLGSKHSDLFAFRLYTLGSGIDVEFPEYVDVYGSDNNKDFLLLGRMYAPISGDNFAYTLILPEYVHARYIRFDLPEGRTNYWFEEAEVLAGRENADDEELYPAVRYPKVTEDLYWSSSEKDYSTRQNLVLGKIQQVASSYYMSDSVPATSNKQTAWDSPVLTDGQRAKNTYCYGGDFFYHYGGGAIDFFYDLEKVSAVDSVNVGYLEQLDWGINHPKYITVLLSDDATHWYPVHTEQLTHEANRNVRMMMCEMKLDKTYAARFVRVRIESAVLFVDEIEVFGTKKVSSSACRLSESGITPAMYYTNDEDMKYCSTEDTGVKAKDIILVYGEKGDEKSLLPLVAHLDKDGNITDTFMDGFLYCPTGVLPSGNQAHLSPVKTDWEYLFKNTFDGITGFNSLESVVGDVKKALGKDDYKVQVYISLLNPSNYNVTTGQYVDFGDIDGDGVSETFETPEDRRKVLDWYINKCLDEFASRGYKNLELGGFYWINEAVSWENDDSHIIKEVADAVHDADSYFLWIPYYNANRYFLGYELGFDLVCMQPNYAFTCDKPLYNFTATASRMKKMNMCIEIEESFQSLFDPIYARNYMLYLYYGATMGYMNDTVHIYYDDINNFSDMAYSTSELCRIQYDATYGFAKGKLEVFPEKVSDKSFETAKSTYLTGSVRNDEKYIYYTLLTSPEHGYVTLSDDGSFVYYPDKGYTGEDSFTYTYNRFLGESEPCTVKITVK